MSYLLLAVAVVAEVIATSSLKAADGFTRLGPSLVVILGYAIAFYSLSLTLRTIPLGVAYAIWAGAGTALIVFLGWAVYKQAMDFPAVAGISLIVAGTVILNLFSKTALH